MCGQPPRYPDDIAAGQELDALVAKRIFGLDPYGNHRWARPTFRGAGVQYFHCHACNKQWSAREASPPCEAIVAEHYSTSIAAAWEIVQGFMASARTVAVNIDIGTRMGEDQTKVVFWLNGIAHEASGPTAPLAICWAALKAKGVNVSYGE